MVVAHIRRERERERERGEREGVETSDTFLFTPWQNVKSLKRGKKERKKEREAAKGEP